MFVFGTFGTCGTFGTFGTCLALDCSEHLVKIDENQTKIGQNQPKTPKVNMLKFGDVSFDFGFEWCLGSATGYVAKISMLRLNIGSGMLRLSSCMLRLGLRLSIGSCILKLGLFPQTRQKRPSLLWAGAGTYVPRSLGC